MYFFSYQKNIVYTFIQIIKLMSELNNNSIKVKSSCSLMELNIGLPRKDT